MDKIKNVVDEGEARRDEEIVKYNGDLNNSIEELKRRTTEVRVRIQGSGLGLGNNSIEEDD